MQQVIITRRKLRAWGACYTSEHIRELVPAAGLTPLEILALDIPATDRLWVVLRKSVIPEPELRLLACAWAERALALIPVEKVDSRSVGAICVAREFAAGCATAAELKTAREAAAAARAEAAEAAAWAAVAAAEAVARAEAAAASVPLVFALRRTSPATR